MSTNSIDLQASLPVVGKDAVAGQPSALRNSLIYVVPVAIALTLVAARAYGAVPNILKEGNMTVLALLAYLSATVIFVTYFLGKEALMLKIGLWTMAFGYVMNHGAWGVRWVEYVDHAKLQPALAAAWASYPLTEKISHTFPLNNLYDIGLAFTGFAVLATLIISSRENFRFLGGMVMPIASVIIILIFFLGNDINTLQPILRSYWRPIHVSIAAISYGVCLVSFGIALLYLLKDKVRIESVALWIALFGIVTYVTIGDFKILTTGTYGLGARWMGSPLNLAGGGSLRATLPGVGLMMQLGTLLYFAAAAALAYYYFRNDEKAKLWGNRLMVGALLSQVVVFGAIFYQMKSIINVNEYINPAQHKAFGAWLAKRSEIDPTTLSPQELTMQGSTWLSQNASGLKLSFESNPIELSLIVTLIACSAFAVLFAYRGKSLLEALPNLNALDDMVYKTVSVVFPMLAMMLITGAVWANESWGTYWSWDPKETWALVTWLAYAGYLHTRLVHGWKGRSSAYFAVIGFIFVIFTYLGVSFLLPGLHSYAGVE